MPGFIPDEIQRFNIPDLYPRRDDPFRPGSLPIPGGAPAGAHGIPGEGGGPSDFPLELTGPGPRPVVFQQALNFQVNLAAGVAQPLIANGSFQCDTMVIDVYNGVTNSVFFGFGSNINNLNGLEIRAGLPLRLEPENTREMWELQRCAEAISWMLGAPLEHYRAPRVVFDASKYYLFATVATSVAVMLFTVPEFQ